MKLTRFGELGEDVGGTLGGYTVLRADLMGKCHVAPIEDVVTATGGVLGSSSVLRAAGVAVEEVVDLRANLTGERRIGVWDPRSHHACYRHRRQLPQERMQLLEF
jgi:hypothetical protein